MRRQRAVITVFFSLLSVIFLAVSFAVIEAVRTAGARAACANASTLGLWSVFSEYDNTLLEDYGLFAVDGGAAGGPVSQEFLLSKLDRYLSENQNVTADMSGKLPGLLMDPWKITAVQKRIDRYALLTDQGGNYYYQQAVEYMRKTAWANALGKLKAMYSDSQGIRQAESEFEVQQRASHDDMKSFDQEVEAAKQELMQGSSTSGEDSTGGTGQGDGTGNVVILAEGEDAERLKRAEEEGRKKNPLEKIRSLQSKSVLELVLGKGKVSGKTLDSSGLLSKRRGNRGALVLDTPRGGQADNLLFCEYLLDHFPDCSDHKESSVLDYQLEYLIMGKYSDEENLKKIAKKLLFLREGMNYAFLVTDSSCNAQVSALARMVLGWTGKPALIAAFKHAILLAWAYGESLFDVRVLLHAGRVPLKKSAQSWNVPLERLISLETDLQRADHIAAGGTTGLNYKDFLRILVNMTSLSRLKKRSLDLIEQNVRTGEGKSSFRIDNCVIGMTIDTDWEIPSVFGRVPAALLGTKAVSFRTNVKGGFAYGPAD